MFFEDKIRVFLLTPKRIFLSLLGNPLGQLIYVLCVYACTFFALYQSFRDDVRWGFPLVRVIKVIITKLYRVKKLRVGDVFSSRSNPCQEGERK